MILRAYRVELDPNNVQRTAMLRHAGAVRFIYNWGLAAITQSYAERKAATPEGERVKGTINPMGLMVQLPALKVTHPWLAEVTAQALQASLRNLDKAFQSFSGRSPTVTVRSGSWSSSTPAWSPSATTRSASAWSCSSTTEDEKQRLPNTLEIGTTTERLPDTPEAGTVCATRGHGVR